MRAQDTEPLSRAVTWSSIALSALASLLAVSIAVGIVVLLALAQEQGNVLRGSLP